MPEMARKASSCFIMIVIVVMDYLLFCVAMKGVAEFWEEIDDEERRDKCGECQKMRPNGAFAAIGAVVGMEGGKIEAPCDESPCLLGIP